MLKRPKLSLGLRSDVQRLACQAGTLDLDPVPPGDFGSVMCSGERPWACARGGRTERALQCAALDEDGDGCPRAWLSAKGQVVHAPFTETGKHLSIGLDSVEGERADQSLFQEGTGFVVFLCLPSRLSRHWLTGSFHWAR